MQQQQNDIATTQATQEEQNARDLEAFTKSQEAYKASQIAMIEKEENLSRQRMAAIFGATGQDSSTDTISTF
jgi:DNA-binding transcriptional regulator YiaG